MRLGLRARITALLLVLSVAPPGAVVWFIRERVLGLVRAEDVGRVEDALAEFGAAIEREGADTRRSEEHTSELQSLAYLVCRLLLEKKKKNKKDLNISRNKDTAD